MKKKFLIFWIITVFLLSGIFLITLNKEMLLRKIIASKQEALLNKVCGIAENRSFDYYNGKIEDVLLGPFNNIVFHLIFVFYCILYIDKLNSRRFFISVFVFLIITKFNVLFYPPYGDAIGGPFAEAIWLKRNNFNYMGLFNQPGYSFGGPKVYFFSIYPTYLAILFKMIPNVKSFLVVNHILVYGFSAVIVLFARKIMQKDFNDVVSTLTSIVLLAVPIFQSQTEAINMEVPCMLFSVVSIYYLTRKNILWASIYALVATLVKGHGVFICATVFFITILLFALKDIKKKRVLIYGFAAMIIAILKVESKFFLKDQHASAGMIKLFAGWPSLKYMRHPYIFIFCFFVFSVFVIAKIIKHKDVKGILLDKYFAQFVVFVSGGMWYLLFLNFYAVSPRYMIAVTPYVIMAIVYAAVILIPKIKKLGVVLLTIIVGITAYNSYDLSHKGQGTTYHVLSEKSLQYRNDLKLSMKVSKLMETEFSRFTIGAPFIVAQMLRFPELGFVKKPMDVLVYGMYVTYGGIKNFEGLNKIDLKNTIWIATPDVYSEQGGLKYPISDYDKVLKKFELGDNFVEAFMGGFAIEQRLRILEAFRRNRLK